MIRRQRVSAKRRRAAGGHTGTEDRADVIEHESEASFPASEAPGWTPVSCIGSSGSPEESARVGRKAAVVSRTTSEEAQATPQLDIQLKRAYEPPAADGIRILVDLAAGSHEGGGCHRPLDARSGSEHRPAAMVRPEFRREYARELRARGDLLDEVRSLARRGRVTLLFGARDETHNDAVALREVLLK